MASEAALVLQLRAPPALLSAFNPPPPPWPRSLKVEELTNAISLGFLGLQFLLGALAAARFAGAARVT